ncbi:MULTISPECIES: MATE family efflux transporter [Dietzia]|uniref:MATE family efflux transporter n=1 Tax=Dietzia TaxID=37914 RepID=UPI0020C43260|nr:MULTISPECIES: MATE family efflux transporter [Dietzia]MCT1711456.1 MATE family efflux transporter [Dietzia cinnamea]MCT2265715.1 MATE family efflux transporter [Dietzia cinnamea]MCT2273681.1 MATE family efflux transporter [Dietzia cinnamea]
MDSSADQAPTAPRSASRPEPEPKVGVGAIGRRLWSIALPVLPVLSAEPVYLLIDGIIVGRQGADALAALGVGALVLLVLGTQMNFLSYGTTARSARLHGAGRRTDAVAEGVQATWIALAVGALVVAAVTALMGPLTRALAADAEVAAGAAAWLRVAVWGIPCILVASAGHGWMRGVQRLRTPLVLVAVGIGVSTVGCVVLVPGLGPAPEMGLVGSAWSNLAGQLLMAGGFLTALVLEHKGSLRPRRAVIVSQLRMGVDLIIRTASFQITFAVATTAAAAAGVNSLAAHHLAQQLWSLYSLVLDSVAIAAQSLVGAALGAGLAAHGRALARAVIVWSLGLGVALALLTVLFREPMATLLAGDAGVADRLVVALIGMAVVVLPAAVVFGLDGVLLGAGDAAYLRTSTVIAALFGFLPVLLATRHFGWGLSGIWWGMGVFVGMRLVAVGMRVRGDRWVVLGARTPEAAG